MKTIEHPVWINSDNLRRWRDGWWSDGILLCKPASFPGLGRAEESPIPESLFTKGFAVMRDPREDVAEETAGCPPTFECDCPDCKTVVHPCEECTGSGVRTLRTATMAWSDNGYTYRCDARFAPIVDLASGVLAQRDVPHMKSGFIPPSEVYVLQLVDDEGDVFAVIAGRRDFRP